MEDSTQKKRGRKPKYKQENEDDAKIKKKRGRKPTGKIYELNKSLISNISLNIPDCIIAHLPLNEKDITKIIGHNKNINENIKNEIIEEKIIQSYNSFIIEEDENLIIKYDNKCLELENLKKKYDELLEKYNKFSYLEDKISDNGTIQKKYYIANANIVDIYGNNWKSSIDTNCWWCSHTFNTVPVGLPNKYYNNKFYLYGCFCSFNCAHSYNLELKDYKIWERYSLLNYIKKILFNNENTTNIVCAPPKEVLKIYGGTLTIDEFRDSSIFIPKNYYHLLPPIIPIFSVIEEIPKFFYQDKNNKKNNFSELKIKRSKPLILQNNNLLNLLK
jgi:hypothetical protein